tara:strand:- start:38 stop:856 length:819 start_codon:yes stop_codon:yes gene_type:complete
MAYPTVSAPYGFKPVSLIGGQVFAGSTRDYPIQYNYGTAIYYGDFVTTASGYTVIATVPVSTTNTTTGVFLGCYYTNPTTKQRQYSQYYPGNVTAGDITAIVGDDPDQVFRCAVTAAAGSTTIASASSILVGQNMAGNTLVGSASTGNGAGAVVAATANTSGGGFRVLGLVPDTEISTSATYVSGTGTTSLVVSGLTVGQYIPIGTDVFNLVNGQLQFTGSSTTAASTVTTTGSTTLTVVASTATVAGTVALVQAPEVLVKLNFGAHRYYVA